MGVRTLYKVFIQPLVSMVRRYQDDTSLTALSPSDTRKLTWLWVLSFLLLGPLGVLGILLFSRKRHNYLSLRSLVAVGGLVMLIEVGVGLAVTKQNYQSALWNLAEQQFPEEVAKLKPGEPLPLGIKRQVEISPEGRRLKEESGTVTPEDRAKYEMADRQKIDDEALASQAITPDEWRDRLRDRRNQSIGVSNYRKKLEEFADKPPKNDNEKALQSYYKLWQSFDEEQYGQYDKKGLLVRKGTGIPSPDVNRRLVIYISKLSSEQREYLQENLHPGATKKVKEYYDDMAILKPYWGIEEWMEWEYPMMAELKRKKTLAKANGNELRVREIDRFPGYRQYEHELMERRKTIRKSDMQVDYLLKKWGYTSSYLHRENKLRMIGAR